MIICLLLCRRFRLTYPATLNTVGSGWTNGLTNSVCTRRGGVHRLLGKDTWTAQGRLIGGALGTLPDLDVFLPFDDPIDSFVYHRGWTHSVFVHALATPVLGEGLRWLFKDLHRHRWLAWITVFLCLSTHAIIDAMTVYGTRIFWPFYPDPVGVGSVFIIDPFYSLPLLGVVVWALCSSRWSARLRNGVAGALVATTAYLD